MGCGWQYLLRAMAFIDYENFDIALKKKYKEMGKPFPRLSTPTQLMKIYQKILKIKFLTLK